MERTKKPKREEPTPMFEMERSKRVTQYGVKTFREDIEEFMIPMLQKYGYDGQLVSVEDVTRRQKRRQEESYRKEGVQARDILYHVNTGLILEIWKKGFTTIRIPVKPVVIESATPRALKDHPRWNLQAKAAKWCMTEAHESARIINFANCLYSLDVHFLIMTRTGQFWLGKYSSIKFSDYHLTYRKDPELKDRIARNPKAEMSGYFRSIDESLTSELKSAITMYHANNTYDANK
jgi:hypothetical protein